MALSDTDLLLVQRGSVPYRATADQVAAYSNSKIELGDSKDIPIASGSQLGVIKVGTNLEIDSAGTLSAVLPAGTSYEGTWTNATTPPAATTNGQFWIWEGGEAVLNNALWGISNGEAISDNDRLLYDGTSFDVLPAGSGGLTDITGTAPIIVSAVLNGEQDVSIPAASASSDGYMSKESFAQLESLVSTPGGLASVIAGENITVNTSEAPGTPATPQIGVTTNSFIPYDISTLQDLA